MKKDNCPQLIKGDIAVDDRGKLSFVNDFNFKGVKRFYIVENHQTNFTRAWHAHKKEAKYVIVLKGSAIVAAVKIDNWKKPSKKQKVFRYVLSEDKPSVLYIPNGYANGFKSLTSDLKIMYLSTSTIEESKGDDIRYSADYFPQVWDVVER